MPLTILFWASFILLLYVFAGYPLLLMALTSIFSRPVRKQPILPSVTLVIPAYNEGSVIQAKIRNSLELDYPPEKLTVVVASDGSTDETVSRACELADGVRVRLVSYEKQRGKLHTLNETVRDLTTEIVTFSDATSMLERGSLRALVANFADSRVGAVSGTYRVSDPGRASLGPQEGSYWKYETFLKLKESCLGSVLGCHGSLYAIRRMLYPYPPPNTVNDDYVIPIRILERGYRIAYEPAAVAVEHAREMQGFSRRVRVMVGNFEQLREMKRLLSASHTRELFFFLSHKVGRLLAPFAMLMMLLSNYLLLSTSTVYECLWWAQISFYSFACVGGLMPMKPSLLRVPYYFCSANTACLVGFCHAMRSGRRVAWKARV